MEIKSPHNYPQELNYRNLHIEYSNFREFCQGSPIIGRLLINKKNLFFDTLFGVPLLIHDKSIFIPVYYSWFGSGFKLGQIDLSTMKLKLISKKYALVLPYRLEDNEVFYFIDLQNTISKKSRIR